MTAEAIPLAARLKRGAQMLGAFWRSKQRCTMGWGILGDKETLILCDCDKPTRFCMGKKQWVALAMTERVLALGEYGVVLMMTPSEWDATGCVRKTMVDDIEVRVGKAPGAQMTMEAFVAISSDPESGKRILGLLKAFPGSKVEAVAQKAD